MCDRGVTGILCALCDSGWYRSGRHLCARCAATGGAAGYVAGAAILLLGLLALMRRRLGSRLAPSELSETIVPAEATAHEPRTSHASHMIALQDDASLEPHSEAGVELAGGLVLENASAQPGLVSTWCGGARDIAVYVVVASLVSAYGALVSESAMDPLPEPDALRKCRAALGRVLPTVMRFLRLSWQSLRIVWAMCQVLIQLDLAVASPLRGLRSMVSVDLIVHIYQFECHGVAHSYYRSWWLSTVGQLALLLGLAVAWAAWQSQRTGDGSFSVRAASGAFLVIFMW